MNLDIPTTIRSLLLAVVVGMAWTAATVQASFPTPYNPASEDSSQYATIAHPGKVVVTGEADPGASVSVDGRPAAARQGRYFADEIALDNTASPVAAGIDIAATLGAATETRSVEAFVPAALSSLEYDADGNLAFDGRNDYTWDAENRLVEISTRSGHETVGAVFPSFRQRMDYDDLGRRTRSRTWHKIGGTEHLVRDDAFVYDGWRLAAVLSGHDGALRQRFAWGLDLSHTVGGAGNAGGLLVFEDSVLGQSHFPRYDGKGNVVGLIAAKGAPAKAPAGTPGAGEMSATYEYDPFGSALAATGHSATRNPFRFGTVLQDPVTRYSYYGYRFYDPAHGRWLSRDPLAEAGGLNLYGFVGNDPVNAVDVLGMVDWWDVSSFLGDFAKIGGTTAWNGVKTVGRGLLFGTYDLTHAAQGFSGDIGYEIGMHGFDAVMSRFSLGVYDEAIWWRDSFNALNDPCYRHLLSESLALNLYNNSEEYAQVAADASLGNLAGAGIMRFGNANLRNPFRKNVAESAPAEVTVVPAAENIDQLSPLLQLQKDLSILVNRQAAVVDRWLGSSSNRWAQLYRSNLNTKPNFAKGIRGRFLDIRTRSIFRDMFREVPGTRIDRTILGSGNRLRPDLYLPDVGGRSVIFDVGGSTKVVGILKYQDMADDIIPLIPAQWVP